MSSLKQDIKTKFLHLHVLEKIIVLNTSLFFLGIILNLLGINLLDWFSLPYRFSEVLSHPWSIITYGFLHHSLGHLFFNMLVLYFIAQSFANLFKPRLSFKIYILGVIFGGLAFVFVSMLIPDLLRINGPLVGASAGVRACILFLCVYWPNKPIGFFSFRFPLKYLGIAMVLLDLPGLMSLNSGGTVAHIGGYLSGFLYAKQLKIGKDLGSFLDVVLDYLKSVNKLKTVHKSKSPTMGGKQKKEFNAFPQQKQIDLILDKISKSGYDSLTQAEKDFLFRAGKK
ncbi:rhomboid family intramembrane serine protease [Formosa sp. Hel3_A1_48]|jgi:membrane associated rhomboid family serine protease|uniref:rhomboid family intramembrane serine protease n=1 Tax=Formosa sp. Hel3_A1_48 TaxID=1336795 RepID=UPI00084E373E